MTKKRLTRELKWGFQYFPYHQLRIKSDIFTGWAAVNYLTDGEYYYWDFPKAGSLPVAGKGMCWLTLIPDGQKRSITAKFTENRRVSVWYVDVIDSVLIDDDGVVAFMDEYLDVKFTPSGDVIVEDKDELEAAYHSGELSKEQYEQALQEGENIISELCSDVAATEKWCRYILEMAEKTIRQNPFTVFLDIDGVLNVYNPDLYYQELIPEAVKQLADLVHRTNAQVVVISNRRFGSIDCEQSNKMLCDNRKRLQEAFAANNVAIADVTSCEATYDNRASEIRAYLAEHPEIKKYAILDDCFGDDYSSDDEIKRHLIFVDAPKGLQVNDCIRACKLMNEIV